MVCNSIQAADLACRWGGEEFVIVFPDCDEEHAVRAAERVRVKLMTESTARDIAMTASFGVAEHRGDESFDETVARADAALRRAKAGGRNQVVSASEHLAV